MLVVIIKISMSYTKSSLLALSVLMLVGAGCAKMPTAEERTAAQAEARTIKVGSYVGYEGEDGKTYSAIVTEIKADGQVEIQYDDQKTDLAVSDLIVFPTYENVSVGDSVKAAWEDGLVYTGKVIAKESSGIRIRWDDDGKEDSVPQGRFIKL